MVHPALALLHRQRDAWNAGDLDGYLASCASDIVYLTRRGPVVGRQAVRSVMAAAYPTPAAMGSLGVDVLRADVGDTCAHFLLRVRLVRAGIETTGHAIVALELRNGAWCMTHDATVG